MKINRTTQRTVQILKLISSVPEGVTLDEICEKLELPKTSAYDIVTTLVAMDMVNLTKAERQIYTIGLAAYRIGINYTNNLNFIEMIEPELKAFAKEIAKTVFFGVPSDHEIIYISKFEPENPIITTATVGSKNPMYCTSLGKAVLANLDGKTAEMLINRTKFKPRTKYTILTKKELKEELKKVREQGYALDFRELEEHMLCVGAPVFDRDGAVAGAISVSGLYRKDEDYHGVGQAVKEKAAQVSRLMGYIV